MARLLVLSTIGVPILLLDQLLKASVHCRLLDQRVLFARQGIALTIIPAINRGAAGGLLATQPALLLTLRAALLAGLGSCFFRFSRPRTQAALSLIVAGGLGNSLDVFLYGHVIDMLAITCANTGWICNLADVAIFAGSILLLFSRWSNE